jgi:hypothetical protein
MITTLPDLPSELIRLALHDLELCANDDKYDIDMGLWYKRHDEGYCSVCLAGSVMAQEFDSCFLDKCMSVCDEGDEGDTEIGPFEVSAVLGPLKSSGPSVQGKLRALNSFRGGFVSEGLDYLGVKSTGIESYMHVACYGQDSEAFKRDMLAMVAAFENVGL